MSLKRDKKIIEEWKQLGRMKQLNQKLYDELDVALMFTLEYPERNTLCCQIETGCLEW
jgi:hypothetical protein